MKNKGVYLSEAVSTSMIIPGKLNLITTPPGSGKTTFATRQVVKLIRHPDQAVYLIDTLNGMTQIERHNDIIEQYDPLWRTNIQDDMYRFSDSKVTIMTYQKFGMLCKYYPQFIEKLKLIICDEFHNIFWQSADESGSRYAIKAIKERSCHIRTLVLALTATPSEIYKHFPRKRINHILPDKPVQEYETFNTLHHRNLRYELSKLQVGSKALVYVPHIESMVEYRDFLQQRGHRCEAIWSIRNIDYVMDERQKNILEAIVSTEEIPNDIDILIINRSSETSINIRSKLTHIFVAMDSCDIITQVRGRYRDDLQNLHIITQKADLVVPNDYLGRPLFGEDTDELCRVLNVKRDNGALAKWRTIKELLPNYGYSVTALPRKANRHSYLICKDR